MMFLSCLKIPDSVRPDKKHNVDVYLKINTKSNLF